MTIRTARPDVIVRGFCYNSVSFELAEKCISGAVAGSDIIRDIEQSWGSVGIWWGTVGMTGDDFYGSVEDARMYAEGSGDNYIPNEWEWMEEYQGGPSAEVWPGAEIEVVLVGKRPQRDYGAWNPTQDNGEGSIWESTSFLSEGDRVELVEIQYCIDGREWRVESVSGLTITASRTAYVSDDIYESYYDTDRLVALVMNAYTWDGDGPLWELVANSPEEAQTFFDSLDEDERRTNVAEVFENGGWDLSGIGHKFATRTAAEPGGVLPWVPSDNGYYWITKTDGTVEAVTNDGVNRMYLYDEGYGWTWEVLDSIGLVESGNFGTALKGGDALRDRANDLLAEFDTNPLRRTRGPSRGFQDDYTQAPNQLWGSRTALFNETGNDDGVAIVLTMPEENREALALPDGLPVEDIHITLGYFGSVEDLSPDAESDLRQACEWVSGYADPFTVKLGGLIRFSGPESDAFVLNADSPEIDKVRGVLLGLLRGYDNLMPDDTHGFTPHCTLGYLEHSDSLPFDRWEPVEVPITAIELWYGTDRHVFPIGADPVISKRKTTSQRYAERLRKEGRR